MSKSGHSPSTKARKLAQISEPEMTSGHAALDREPDFQNSSLSRPIPYKEEPFPHSHHGCDTLEKPDFCSVLASQEASFDRCGSSETTSQYEISTPITNQNAAKCVDDAQQDLYVPTSYNTTREHYNISEKTRLNLSTSSFKRSAVLENDQKCNETSVLHKRNTCYSDTTSTLNSRQGQEMKPRSACPSARSRSMNSTRFRVHVRVQDSSGSDHIGHNNDSHGITDDVSVPVEHPQHSHNAHVAAAEGSYALTESDTSYSVSQVQSENQDLVWTQLEDQVQDSGKKQSEQQLRPTRRQVERLTSAALRDITLNDWSSDDTEVNNQIRCRREDLFLQSPPNVIVNSGSCVAGKDARTAEEDIRWLKGPREHPRFEHGRNPLEREDKYSGYTGHKHSTSRKENTDHGNSQFTYTNSVKIRPLVDQGSRGLSSRIQNFEDKILENKFRAEHRVGGHGCEQRKQAPITAAYSIPNWEFRLTKQKLNDVTAAFALDL